MSSQVHAVVETTLSSYLNDHLAGSKAAMQLVTTIQDETRVEPFRLEAGV